MSLKDKIQRWVLPIADQKHKDWITYDAKDPEAKYPKIEQLRPPKGVPNVLIVLIDDVGFGSSSAFGGPCQTPNAEKRRRTASPGILQAPLAIRPSCL
jgi:hypothetical protein